MEAIKLLKLSEECYDKIKDNKLSNSVEEVLHFMEHNNIHEDEKEMFVAMIMHFHKNTQSLIASDFYLGIFNK